MFLEEYECNLHPLVKAEEFTKNIYLRFLLSMGQVNNDNEFFGHVRDAVKYLADVCGANEEIGAMIKDSLIISNEELNHFSEEMEKTGLSYIFIVDCMLIVFNYGEIKNDVLEYITGMTKVLNLSQAETDDLIALVKIILEKDRRSYRDIFTVPGLFNHGNFNVYARKFSSVYVVNTLEDYDDIQYDDDIQYVVFENLRLTNMEDVNFSISEKSKVVLCNCQFRDVQFLSGISCENIEKLVIIASVFDGINDGVFYLSECGSVSFLNCKFRRCPSCNAEDTAATSAMCIVADNTQSLRLEQCFFENCIAFPPLSMDDNFSVEGIAAIAKLDNVQDFRLYGCTFKDCVSSKIEGYEKEGTLFNLVNSECRKAKNCTLNNCCPTGESRLKLE